MKIFKKKETCVSECVWFNKNYPHKERWNGQYDSRCNLPENIEIVQTSSIHDITTCGTDCEYLKCEWEYNEKEK